MSVATLFGFSIVGMLIVALFHEKRVSESIVGGEPWMHQIGIGLAFGLLSGVICLFFVRMPVFRQVKTFFSEMMSKLDLGLEDIVFYSFCAGVGEELFFRVAMQPLVGEWSASLFEFIHRMFGNVVAVSPEETISMGIWVTAVFFVGLHGYLNPRNIKLSFFGLLLIFVSGGLGLLYDKYGFFAAATAHFVYDVIMFAYVVYYDQD